MKCTHGHEADCKSALRAAGIGGELVIARSAVAVQSEALDARKAVRVSIHRMTPQGQILPLPGLIAQNPQGGAARWRALPPERWAQTGSSSQRLSRPASVAFVAADLLHGKSKVVNHLLEGDAAFGVPPEVLARSGHVGGRTRRFPRRRDCRAGRRRMVARGQEVAKVRIEPQDCPSLSVQSRSYVPPM